MLTITVGIAGLVHLLTGLPLFVLILAYSPGALAEMSLIALYLQADTALVAAHHLARIAIVIPTAPFVFRHSQKFF